MPGVERVVGRWWNGSYGRLTRRDVWLKVDGPVWRVQARKGDADANLWSRDYLDEAAAREMVTTLLERGGGPNGWRDLTSLY